MVKIKDARPNSKKLSKSRSAYSVMTRSPGSFPRITGNGVWGDPRLATKEKGHRLLKEIVTNLIQIISELQM
jgi:creatinine amidohydrolase/Fe(II)-dependent formamide hydrolase-like protein